LLRATLYGTFPEDAPCWGDLHPNWKQYYCREMLWACTLKQFVARRMFRYSDLLKEARALIATSGPSVPTGLEQDLELLKVLEHRLRDRASREGRWDTPEPTPEERIEIDAEATWKTFVLKGICPLCGGILPCPDCNIPVLVPDGRGGLRAA
jgi:hypothetical protein